MLLGTRNLEPMRMLLWKMQLDALLNGTLGGKEHDFSMLKGRDEVYQILGRGEEDIAGESL